MSERVEQIEKAISLFEHGQKEEAAKIYHDYLYTDDPVALYQIGHLIEKGIGFDKDFTVARDFYERSANQGYLVSYYCLGKIYYEGKGVPVDKVKAYKYFLDASPNDPGVQIYLSLIEGDWFAISKIISEHESNAAKGDASAMANLCYFYEKGGIFVTQSSKKAYAFAKKAYELGDGLGAYNLSTYYENGKIVAHNLKRSIELKKEAYERGYYYAALPLGDYYANWEGGVPHFLDPSSAFIWYLKGADHGFNEAKVKFEKIKPYIDQLISTEKL